MTNDTTNSGSGKKKNRSCNPPTGTRSRAARVAQQLLDREAEPLIRKTIARAMKNDSTAQRLCVERMLPPVRDLPMQFPLPPLNTAADALIAIGKIAEAVSRGELSESQAKTLTGLVDTFLKTLEAVEFERRMTEAEAAVSDRVNR